MTTAAAGAEVLGDLSDGGLRDLLETLLYCRATFAAYRDRFDSAGVRVDDLPSGGPLEVLSRLRPLDAADHALLSDESLAVVDGIVDVEVSSGTTARPKRRFISGRDAELERELLARLFSVCGVGPGDRVACLDVDPLAVMASFLGGLERLGVGEAYAYTAGPDFDRSVEGLRRLDPTVLISTPSIIDRCLSALTDRFSIRSGRHLGKVIYVGEPMSARTREALEDVVGVEVFGYYGAAETSAMGIECSAHDGVHLFTDHNLFELLPRGGGMLVTSLKLRATPLLRYSLLDRAVSRPGACRCGLDYPRVDVLGRVDDGFTLLGARLWYAGLHEAVYGGAAGPMQVVLTMNGRERLEVVLPRGIERDAEALRGAVLAVQPDLEFLVGGGYVDFEVSFAAAGNLTGGRKSRRVIDLRGADAN